MSSNGTQLEVFTINKRQFVPNAVSMSHFFVGSRPVIDSVGPWFMDPGFFSKLL